MKFELFPTQLEFVNCQDPFPAFIGGYGAGKTYVHAVKSIIHAVYYNPGLAGLIVAPTYRDLRDTNIPTLQELLDTHRIHYLLHKTNYELYLPWWRSKILLRSADDPQRLKGPNVAWAGIDEVARIDESIWGVMVSRVRHPAAGLKQTFAVGTPEGLNWVYERWVENPEPGYRIFQASTLENKLLGEDYLKALRSSHDAEELKQKLSGRFVDVAKGRVYREFDRNVHLVAKSPLDPDRKRKLIDGLPLCLSCDFNVDPCCWLAIQHHRGTIYVAEEIVLNDTSTAEMISEFKARGLHRHPSGVVVYGDPSGRSRSTSASLSDYALLREAGFTRQNVARSAPDVRDRVHAVNARLRAADGSVRLLINSECKTLIRDLERVRWKEGAYGVLDKRDGQLTHASDALGYFIHREYSLSRTMPRRTRVADAIKRKRR